ncbi:class V chitinase Chi100 [Penicillium maclennaniae]|uniref:class V chitinase Chi100 n=1 Tax=Penicillium maclennaniae TaxID=1343394 RepID=UPI0025424345|nr:class V chitinase Chi100 [Penicillium maclennaniae]KAJ5662384.1 class V chitinase Chi100 [Penicillium maclennaniae]
MKQSAFVQFHREWLSDCSRNFDCLVLCRGWILTWGSKSCTVLQTQNPTVPWPYETTTDGTVIAYATSTLSYIAVSGYSLTETYGAGKSTTISVPSFTANRAMWDELSAYSFLIYDIDHSNVDEDALSSSLQNEEKGGAMLAWEFSTETTDGTAAKFNLPVSMKSGCVERAIVTG